MELTNEQILSEREAKYNEKPGARVGDFLKLPNGEFTRFTYDWGSKIQTTGFTGGSYYLSVGHISYSGGLYAGVKKSDIRQTDEVKEGEIWFFDGDRPRAGGGVYFSMNFRVFELVEGADTSGLS